MGRSCGFYPGVEPDDHQYGTAATFEAARADFEVAWQHLLLTLPEEAFQDWRDHQAITAWKYAMHDHGLPLPTDLADGQSRCFCGIEITTRNVSQHVLRQYGFQGRR